MNELIILVGLSGSGKSTLANEYKENGYVIHSSDELRKELYNDINKQNNNNQLFQILYKRIRKSLEKGNNTLLDATNLSYKKRKSLLDSIKTECHKKAIVIHKDFEDCVQYDKNRDRTVGRNVIFRQLKTFNMPNYYEGFDEIELRIEYKDRDGEKVLSNMFKRLNILNQDNSYHKLTIGEHCCKCGDLLQKTKDNNLILAGGLHDIGKEQTKTFYNTKNILGKEAHYYGHEKVSSYLTIGLMQIWSSNDIIDICNLIQFHMLPFSYTEKSKKKHTKMFGEDFMRRLDLLHKADNLAKE